MNRSWLARHILVPKPGRETQPLPPARPGAGEGEVMLFDLLVHAHLKPQRAQVIDAGLQFDLWNDGTRRDDTNG